MSLSQPEVTASLQEVEARLIDLIAEGREPAFVVEEIAALGEDLARHAGALGDWVDEQITVILAKHGLIEEGLGLDEGEEA